MAKEKIDNWIVAVKKSNNEITYVYVVDKLDFKKGEGSWRSKLSVAVDINILGKVIYTAYEHGNGYIDGSKVRAIHHNGTYYLRTDANNIAADNLGNLPEYN